MDREYVQNSLVNAGFTDVQSETLAHIVGQLATKADLDLLRVELRSQIQELRAELRGEMQELRAELAGELNTLRSGQMKMRAELTAAIERSARETQAQMTKMMVGLIISLASIFTLLDLFID